MQHGVAGPHRRALDDPSRNNIRRYLRVHVDDKSLATDDDRTVPFEVNIAILNHIADSRLLLLNNCGHWPPFEMPALVAAQVLAFLRGH